MKNTFNQFENLVSNKSTSFPSTKNKKLRIVTLNYIPSAYRFVTEWIAENGHEHILAVTTPGTKNKATPSYLDIVQLVPRTVSTLVTSKMKSVLIPVLHQLKPDLIICYSFPHRLTKELCEIPTYGSVNIHPSILPAYRGPNPMRQFYEGATRFGATAHRIEEQYDTGEILSQQSAPLPHIVSHDTSVQWGKMIKKCIAEGVEKAISGKSGIHQDHSKSSYAAPFTEEEKWIDFKEKTSLVLRKILGLNLTGGLAKAHINGKVYKIHSAEQYPIHNNHSLDRILFQEKGIMIIKTQDGAVKIETEIFNPNKKYANLLPYAAFVEKKPATIPVQPSSLYTIPTLPLKSNFHLGQKIHAVG